MAQYLKLTGGPAFWPQCCAKCFREDSLIQYDKEIKKATETNYIVASKIVVRSYNNTYPVCKDHHKKIKTGEILYESLDALLKCLFFVAIVPIGMYFLVGTHGIYAASVVLLFGILLYLRGLAINNIPVWVSKIGEDFVVLRFANKKYADEFLLANRGIGKLCSLLH